MVSVVAAQVFFLLDYLLYIISYNTVPPYVYTGATGQNKRGSTCSLPPITSRLVYIYEVLPEQKMGVPLWRM